MQIHNHGESQVIMAYNNWGNNAGQTSDTAIGNNPNAGSAGVPSGTQGLDWTFTSSAASYTTRKLYVLARPGGSAGGSAPVFYAHPLSRDMQAGDAATLTVALAGQGPFIYQWRKNGEALVGQTNPWLDLANVTPADAGTYDVVVSTPNSLSATSLAATITVTGAVDPGASHYLLVVNPNGSVDVTFYGIPGQSYQIQRSTNLQTWTVLQTTVAAPDGTLPYHDPTPPEDAAFYRTFKAP